MAAGVDWHAVTSSWQSGPTPRSSTYGYSWFQKTKMTSSRLQNGSLRNHLLFSVSNDNNSDYVAVVVEKLWSTGLILNPPHVLLTLPRLFHRVPRGWGLFLSAVPPVSQETRVWFHQSYCISSFNSNVSEDQFFLNVLELRVCQQILRGHFDSYFKYFLQKPLFRTERLRFLITFIAWLARSLEEWTIKKETLQWLDCNITML